jgi:phosphoglycolate phosphatase
VKSFTCQPEAVIFDLDGTLIDTADEFIRVVQLMRSQRGLPPLPNEQVRKSVSNGSGALVTLALGSEPETADHEQLRLEFLEHYERILGTSALPYQGMHELVQQLHNAGIPWGVATNKFRRYAEPLMAAMNFQPPANSLVTPCDVTHAKPHPESILLSCHNVGARPKHSLYIGDHKRDIEAGNAAGCFTIAASYGYIEDGDDPTQWEADALASSSEELVGMIMRMIK